jgi:peptidoglycan/LPS O-acetylase OafA/YrhL
MNNRYAFADGLRGLAALWVVFYHLFHGDHVTQLSKYIGHSLSAIIFEYGNLGVPIFFVLSGFVMAVTTNKKIMGASQSAKFMLRRFMRLSPPYYFGIIVTLILLYVKARFIEPTLSFPDMKAIVAHVFYLQGFLGINQINVVYWTLCYEIQFYLVFSVVIYWASRFKQDSPSNFFMLVFTTMPGLLWLGLVSESNPLQFYVSHHLIFINYWYAFSAGAIVGWSTTRQHIVNFEKYLMIFYIATIAIGYIKWDAFAVTAGLTAMVLHLALYKNKMNTWLNFKPLQTLGVISYSLYLIHNNVLGIVARLVRKFLAIGIVTDVIVAMLCILACLMFAFLMYFYIEKPVIKLSQKIKY